MSNAALLVQLMIVAVQNMDALTRLLNKVQAEGRDPTDEEIGAFLSADDAARKSLQDAIDARSGDVAG